uniref:Uncharacterized protein n=1 Tax=Aegilops tauschii subsp. strangulata TaxID=200361 RepID=A0A452Y6C4_AEGTS
MAKCGMVRPRTKPLNFEWDKLLSVIRAPLISGTQLPIHAKEPAATISTTRPQSLTLAPPPTATKEGGGGDGRSRLVPRTACLQRRLIGCSRLRYQIVRWLRRRSRCARGSRWPRPGVTQSTWPR